MANGYEDLRVTSGPRSGATIAVAVHSTALGPALGGVRMWHYDSAADGVADALRLARAMTYKAAAAGLNLGGGKGVICAPAPERPAGELRRRMLLDFGDAVEALGGSYVTAEDVGTSAADMVTIAGRTAHVVGLPVERGGRGDPSPLTARGVQAAIAACLEHRFGSPSVAGVRVCVIGIGNVGSRLARMLAAAGAKLLISDLDPTRRPIAEQLGATWLDPAEAIAADCEVLAPCALGGAINATTLKHLHCQIICGSANNILADDHLATTLATRNILLAPDFIANAGGLINVYAELRDLDNDLVLHLVDRIGSTVRQVLNAADNRRVTPLAAAQAQALERLREATIAAA
ncbi:MAG TPA: Glu/Leu/Phe/Val dehydrogenase dimerization domain-containing protein [Solirubrobacterales bacterium]|jgi:leucine dehydrogenase|nr:Glu/Leu/Phe/Val dehydrogenase dimerization domain-containing protein [Solirubrobacterales bacterium]